MCDGVQRDKVDNLRAEAVAMGTQTLGVPWADCRLRNSSKVGTCRGVGRGFILRTELPSVCTDPRRRATALEVGVVSGRELEPARLLAGTGVRG